MHLVNIANLELMCFESVESAARTIIDSHLTNSSTAIAINPEKVLSSLESTEVYRALAGANIRYIDGIGVAKLAERRSKQKVARVPGCELWQALMSAASKEGLRVFILGGKPEVCKATATKLQQEGVNVVGALDGYFDDEEEVIREILEAQAAIVTVALGSPKQEKFIDRCRTRGVESFMMGVGGTYDVYTGAQKRAPELYRRFHLEWFYRLMREPKRFWRQLKILKFVYLALRGRI